MSSEEGARPQDLGRPHRRTAPGPAPATVEILERYRAAMRGELATLLEELTARTMQETLDGTLAPLALGITARKERWDLAVKLGRELAAPGAGLEDPDPPAPSSPATPRRPARAPRLSARERRSL